MRRFPVILIGIGLLSAAAYAAIDHYQYGPKVVYPLPVITSSSARSSLALSSDSSIVSSATSIASSAPTTPSADLPPSVLIKVPFATQAPLSNWDALHEESCEEASLILVEHYLNGKGITPQEMEDEIQKLVQWETDNGYTYDVTVDELKAIANKVYGLKGTVITDVSINSLKKELAAGHPIIIPAAGQTLGNPYFSGDGPPYHMLVVVGYDSKNFITNDVGTRRGEGYKYSYDTLINAIHDWNGSTETIQSGRKAILVVEKE